MEIKFEGFGGFGDQVNWSMHRNIVKMFAEGKPFFLDRQEATKTLIEIRRDLHELLLHTQVVNKPSP